MVIDDSITKVEIDDDDEGPSSQESTVEVEAQDIEVEGLTPEKELTLVNSRMGTMLGSKVLGFYVFRILICIVGKP